MMVTVTETCSKLYSIEYIVLFGLNGLLVTLKFIDNYYFFFCLSEDLKILTTKKEKFQQSIKVLFYFVRQF